MDSQAEFRRRERFIQISRVDSITGIRGIEAARPLSHVVVAGDRVGGCHITSPLRAIILGPVLGCLWICEEVPNRGVMQHKMAAQIADSYSY